MPNFSGHANSIEKGGAGRTHGVLVLSLVSLLFILPEVVQYFLHQPSGAHHHPGCSRNPLLRCVSVLPPLPSMLFAPPPSTSRPNLISWIGIMPGQALSKLTYKHQGHTKSGENTPLWRSSRAPPSGLHTPALRWLLTLNTASRLASSNIAFPSNLRHLTPRVESSSPVGTSTKDPSHPTQKPSQSSPQASKENR